MPNHFHWMIYVNSLPETENNMASLNSEPVSDLNKSIGVLLRSYTRAINSRYEKSGSLFQQKTKSKNLNENMTENDDYPLTCFLYIHQNPLRAGLEGCLGMWKFSSYKDYAGDRNGLLCNQRLARKLLNLPTHSKSFKELSQKTINEDVLDKIF
jgi:REP element-mobilizing transposase RayT